MRPDNLTASTDFILLGLFSTSHSSLVSFSFLVGVFIMALMENTLMILLIHRDPCLHTPMYFLLSHLSFMDIMHISNIVPKVIADFLSGSRAISFTGCGTQLFLSLMMLGSECLLLAAMSCDRYVAICHPLRYPVLMSERVSMLLAAGCWLVGTLNASVHTGLLMRLPYCSSRVIDHYFCELPALMKLSCTDTSRYERGVDVSAVIFLLIPLSMICASYVQILLTVLQMKSLEARKKAFSTCSFHMVVVIMYYGPFIFTYTRPESYHTPGQDKFLAIFYTIITPTLNPVIYSFRNKDVLRAMKSLLRGSFPYKK
ncbi:olfactory receptor 2AJ1-like [Sciurus carolinensis]|uniref:olfactory receptor 2AJ1-like n=1 Tax=Sciurus carolinensis TaxID=30640 RepID=UPI001FB279B4|nr:olfactory receptor 2AJ1-like [Sciurus carolinensis]